MPNREQISNFKYESAIVSTDITSTGTTNGTIIDTQGFDSVHFIIKVDGYSGGTYTPLINESDDSGMSGETAVADSELVAIDTDGSAVTSGEEAAVALSAAGVAKIAYVGSKRYITCDIVASGTDSPYGATVTVLAAKGDPEIGAVA